MLHAAALGGLLYPGARGAINEVMPWVWGPYSSRMVLPACILGSPGSAGKGVAGINTFQRRARTQALPVLRLWAKLEPK